jgi:hypothetical protein
MARAAAQLDALTVRQLQQDIKTAEVPMVSLRRQANPQSQRVGRPQLEPAHSPENSPVA